MILILCQANAVCQWIFCTQHVLVMNNTQLQFPDSISVPKPKSLPLPVVPNQCSPHLLLYIFVGTFSPLLRSWQNIDITLTSARTHTHTHTHTQSNECSPSDRDPWWHLAPIWGRLCDWPAPSDHNQHRNSLLEETTKLQSMAAGKSERKGKWWGWKKQQVELESEGCNLDSSLLWAGWHTNASLP